MIKTLSLNKDIIKNSNTGNVIVEEKLTCLKKNHGGLDFHLPQHVQVIVTRRLIVVSVSLDPIGNTRVDSLLFSTESAEL